MTGSLYSYLLQCKRLSVPGLGTLFIERSPAHVDESTHQLNPPAFYYRFDKYFDAPGKDFFSFLARQEKISDAEAIRVFNEWAYHLNSNIRADHPTKLGAIGEFMKDANGEVIFRPSGAIPVSYSPVVLNTGDSQVALPEIAINPEEAGASAMDESYAFPEESKKDPWSWYALLLLILFMALLAFHGYQYGFNWASFGLRNLPGF